MPKMDLVFCLLKQQHKQINPAEKLLLEIKLFDYLYNELSNFFLSRYFDYQKLIKLSEKNMCIKLMQEIINDILLTEEYSLAGIANHTNIPEEVLLDIVSGINTNPTLDISRKIFALHTTVRRDLYDQIMRKIVSEYLAV